VVSVGLFIFAIARLDALTSQMQERRAVLHDRQNIQLNFEEVLSLYSRQYETLSTGLDQLRPPQDDVVYLLDDIEAIGRELGLGIKIRLIGPQLSEDSSTAVRYEVSFAGNKAQLDAYLARMDDLPTFIEVQSINIEQVESLNLKELAGFKVIFDIFVK
jgi:Tfp pilus assembly protein PilO